MGAAFGIGLGGDTSPPNGMLPVNRPFGSVTQRERTLNQQLDNLQLHDDGTAFTPVNARPVHGVRRVNALIDKGFQQSGA